MGDRSRGSVSLGPASAIRPVHSQTLSKKKKKRRKKKEKKVREAWDGLSFFGALFT
jgi:hypothetical protein